MKCDCFFCNAGNTHKHSPNIPWHWEGRAQNTVAESLDPNDLEYYVACSLCGHTEKKES